MPHEARWPGIGAFMPVFDGYARPCRSFVTRVRRSQPLEQILRAGNVDLAGRVLDVERLHHAVLDDHGIALRARAKATWPEIDGEAERLGEIAAAVGEELDLAFRAARVLPRG